MTSPSDKTSLGPEGNAPTVEERAGEGAPAADDSPLTLEERVELFIYEVREQLTRMEGFLHTAVVMAIALGQRARVTREEIEATEARLFGNPQPSSSDAQSEGATPAEDSAQRKE